MVAALENPASLASPLAAKPESYPANLLLIDDYAPPPLTRAEPIYIGDEVAARDDIVFGPLRQSPASGKRVPPATMPASAAVAISEEPIAKAVRQGWYKFQGSFPDTPAGSVLKILILSAMAILVVVNVPVFLPLAVFLGISYLIYYGVRTLVMQDPGPSRLAQFHAARRKQLADARQVCLLKPLGTRVAELTGSLLTSAGTIAALGALLLLVVGTPFDGSVDFWSFYAWLVITGTVGSWLLLVAGKCWEGREGQSGSRRLVMIVLGLVVGAGSYALAQFLQFGMHDVTPVSTLPQPMRPAGWYTAGGAPLLPAFLVYFGALFMVPRWWRAVDPLRRHRVSLIAALFAAVWGCFLHFALYFSWPLGIMLAVMISLAVQLSAPWIDWKRAPVRTVA
jgi:hypothetical protein